MADNWDEIVPGSDILIEKIDLGMAKPYKDMRLTPEQITILQEDLCVELVEILVDEWHYPMQQALGILYNSNTFALIQNTDTGLYYQSAGYVFTFLEEELKKGETV